MGIYSLFPLKLENSQISEPSIATGSKEMLTRAINN